MSSSLEAQNRRTEGYLVRSTFLPQIYGQALNAYTLGTYGAAAGTFNSTELLPGESSVENAGATYNLNSLTQGEIFRQGANVMVKICITLNRTLAPVASTGGIPAGTAELRVGACESLSESPIPVGNLLMPKPSFPRARLNFRAQSNNGTAIASMAGGFAEVLQDGSLQLLTSAGVPLAASVLITAFGGGTANDLLNLIIEGSYITAP
mgnify:CR=1 FL=1